LAKQPHKLDIHYHQPPPTSTSRTTPTLQNQPSADTMENGNISQGEGKDPSSFLSDIIGNPVTVKLNSGVVYKGESWAPLTHQ
jgi:hypothetical protein